MSLVEKNPRRRTRAKAPAVMRSVPTQTSRNPKDLPAPFRMPAIRKPVFPKFVVDIRDHGAVGDDQTDCTSAIAAAIAACVKAGGGRVLIPTGKWYTGPIQLQSNIELHLRDDAI